MSETLGTWPVVVENVPVAWGDMDAFGHVNNTIYFRWFETARIAYFTHIGLPTQLATRQPTGLGPILARTTCDFRLPLVFPDTVTIQSTVHKLGTTSFVMGYRVLSVAHDGAVAAEGEGVIVVIDYDTGKKAALPEDLRARILKTEAESA